MNITSDYVMAKVIDYSSQKLRSFPKKIFQSFLIYIKFIPLT